MQTVLVVLGGLVVGYFIGRLFATPGPTRYARVQPPVDETLPPPGESARRAADSVRAFGALVERLAAQDVYVSDVDFEPGMRWQLVVERGADVDRYRESSWETGKTREKRWVTRVSWHAGDEHLRVAKSIHLPGIVPNQWQEEPGSPIGVDGDAIGAAEAFITERFGKGAGPDR